MDFTGEIAALSQRLALCRELVQRRHAVLGEMGLRRGERVLEIGCGNGLMLREIGFALGPHGLAAGLDISEEQITAAARECEGVPAVLPVAGDAAAIPWPEASFDATVSLSVLEFIEDVEPILDELHRVLKPGGRLHCLSTNWSSAFWHGATPAATARLQEAWNGHACHPNLPARLAPLLAARGFVAIRQMPVAIVNPALTEDTFAWWTARMMAAFAVERGLPQAEARAWLSSLEAADAEGEFFFSSLPILTVAIRS